MRKHERKTLTRGSKRHFVVVVDVTVASVVVVVDVVVDFDAATVVVVAVFVAIVSAAVVFVIVASAAAINFTKVLGAAFRLIDPQCIKKIDNLTVFFNAFGICERKSCS